MINAKMCLAVWLGMLAAAAAPVATIDRYEGESCTLLDGVSAGICRHHESCPYLRTVPKTQWVTCSFVRDQPILCCREGAGAQFSSLPTRFETETRVPSKSERMCDRLPPISEVGNHIFNGVEARNGEFPHMAALGYPSKREDNVFRCGASLISDRFLLTAAHCLSPEKPIFARLGVVEILHYDPNDPPADIGIAETILHPNYTGRPLKNDIALLRLNRTITEDFLQPACLYTNFTEPAPNINLTIIGWGSTDPNDVSISPILLKANVTVLGRDECNATLFQIKSSRSTNSLQDHQLCALGRNSQNETEADTCVGDSGGPLELVYDRKVYIVGVTSSGKLCGSRFPGIYTRVSRYLDWIESIVWPD